MQAWYTTLDEAGNLVVDRKAMTRVASVAALAAEDQFYVDHAAGVLRFGPCVLKRRVEYAAPSYRRLSE